MGFLDNSGDIILDAVLTDTGRKRLAQGNGSFRISKFALADDEINYGLYNKNHASGSAYYDLEILQTPVLEAFTNNASSVKSKLITISNTNLLYLPVVKLYKDGDSVAHSTGVHVIASDNSSATDFSSTDGVLNGDVPSQGSKYIRTNQGIDSIAIPHTQQLQSDLYETQYIIEMDNRLGSLTDTDGNIKDFSFLDDDNIASYYLTLGTDSALIADIGQGSNTQSSIAGHRGTELSFMIKASLQLNTSDFLFDQIGLSSNLDTSLEPTGSGGIYKAIDSNIRVIGATTGYSLDIPVRYIRKI